MKPIGRMKGAQITDEDLLQAGIHQTLPRPCLD
jgi:hypothetical protein